jgi:hypothetical protein
MKSDANVVHLNTTGCNPVTDGTVAGSPAAINKVRDRAALQLKQSLQVLFDNADDTLFDMADRSTSNTEQSVFFEAMRDLRLKRKGIERGFLQRLFDAFAELFRHGGARVCAPDVPTFDSLALVHNDDLEESVALSSMIGKVMSCEHLALSHLSTRMNALVSSKMDDKSNPLGPVFLCERFLDACSGLGVEIKVKLIIFKLFEKYVLSGLDQLYRDANDILIEVGVLPELEVAPRRGSPSGAARDARHERPLAPAAMEAGQDMGEVFARLQQLLAQAGGGGGGRHLPQQDALPISNNDLLRLLSQFQRRQPGAVGAEPSLGLHGQLEQALANISAKAGRARTLGQADEDVINLVSMLFEFILDDHNLPDSLKALIARLQIPILKVALLDKAFFSRGSHPARRLLNEVATAALGWNEQDGDPHGSLYQTVEQLVQRLLNDFTDDPGIFAELLDEFLGFTRSVQRRSALLERRMRDAEEGGARVERARRQVEAALNQRLLGRVLPECVVRLLKELWSRVMLWVCLKHGAESAAWQACLTHMDDLIWSVGAHDNTEDRARLLALIPLLLQGLRDGIDEASVDSFASQELFNQLAVLHRQVLLQSEQSLLSLDPTVPAAPTEAVQGLAACGAQGEDRPGACGDQSLPGLSAKQEEQALPLVEVVEEIVLLAPGQSRVEVDDRSVDGQEDMLRLVDALRVGSWVEFKAEGERNLRCKLAAIIKPGNKYVFVNRTGVKVLEKTRMGLAVEFRRESIRMLDDALLFDRALESVIANLQRLKA